MKKTKIIENIALIAAVFSFFYLIGAFVGADFNIKHWPMDTRAIIAFCMAIISIIAITFNNDIS